MNNAALQAIRDIAAPRVQTRICSTRASTAARDVYRVEAKRDGSEWIDISGPLGSFFAATQVRDIFVKAAR